MYAGDLIVQKLFDVPDHYLRIMNTGVSKVGEDLHKIQNIHDYLDKVASPLSPEDAKRAVFEIYDRHKEIRAAIHFLADAMLKNPGHTISVNEILDNLATVNFFSICSKETIIRLAQH